MLAEQVSSPSLRPGARCIHLDFAAITSVGVLFALTYFTLSLDLAFASFPPGTASALNDVESATIACARGVHKNASSCSTSHAAATTVRHSTIADYDGYMMSRSSEFQTLHPADATPIIRTASVVVVAHNEHTYATRSSQSVDVSSCAEFSSPIVLL
jgi:hypothetical protein